ncbi:MAG: type I glyceraldehyde-3-phosphate dehydrogenase [Chloroflexi bacterium]|nr:type I glyceraldehyde-3-phosphate dehydrogenase [Chloroflexota bacterium]
MSATPADTAVASLPTKAPRGSGRPMEEVVEKGLVSGVSRRFRFCPAVPSSPTPLSVAAVTQGVVESTGAFRSRDAAAQHLGDGVRKVVISAPGKDEDWMVIMGVNDGDYDAARHHIISAGSCTTNCVVPMVKVLHDAFGVQRGFMTTIHAYTRDQNLVDAKHKDLRRARAAALNIIPTSSGASQAVGDLIPELAGKFDGMAYRVPTPVVSVVDLVADLDQTASEGAINEAFLAASEGPMKGYLYYERDELVSSDFKNHPGSSIFDAPSTMVLDGDMAKTMAWYDNEWGYSCRIADICALIAEHGLE